MLVSIPVSQGSPGLDLIDHRMRHCLKLEDSNKKQFKCILNVQISKYKLIRKIVKEATNIRLCNKFIPFSMSCLEEYYSITTLFVTIAMDNIGQIIFIYISIIMFQYRYLCYIFSYYYSCYIPCNIIELFNPLRINEKIHKCH